MEPEDDDFLPDGDDFDVKSRDEAVLDEPVVFFLLLLFLGCWFCFWGGGLESVCLLNYPHFQHGCFFVTQTTAYSLSQKQTLECILATCKVSLQSVYKQTPNASLNVTTLFVYKLLKAASCQHC